MQIENTVHLRLNQIKVDNEFNARKKYDGIEELSREIRKDGQINPCIVTPTGKNGDFFLVAGFRRFRALELLDAAKKRDSDTPLVFAQICSFESLYEMAELNLSENMARRNLTTFEIAAQCCKMRDQMGVKKADILGRIGSGGFSRSYVDNLMRSYDNLDPKILMDWSNQEGYCSTDALNKMSKFDKGSTEQLDKWDEMRGVNIDPESISPVDSSKGPDSSLKRPTPSQVSNARDVIQRLPAGGVRNAMLSVFKFINGETTGIKLEGKLLYDPQRLKDEADKVKAKEKAKYDKEKNLEKAIKKASKKTKKPEKKQKPSRG